MIFIFEVKGEEEPLWSYKTDDGIQSVAISADGEYLVIGSTDDNVYLFNKDNSTPIWNYTTSDWIESVAISADGEYIIASSSDHTVGTNC